MASRASPTASAVAAAAHVRAQLARHRQQHASTAPRPPLLVGVQGPQGSGKTTLTRQLQGQLADEALHVVVFSLDDLYLTHADQLALAASAPHNKLLAGRGQPGTHDVALGTAVLHALRSLNAAAGTPLALPVYDKAAFNGAGDRAAQTVEVRSPVDVVLFEGWCLGFAPLEPSLLRERYAAAVKRSKAGDTPPYFLDHALEHIEDLNQRLAAYQQAWWALLDAFVQLAPAAEQREALETIFAWRGEAEVKMKAACGQGMSPEEVRTFVRRYMPSYELFAEGVLGPQSWRGRGLRLELGAQRELLGQCSF